MFDDMKGASREGKPHLIREVHMQHTSNKFDSTLLHIRNVKKRTSVNSVLTKNRLQKGSKQPFYLGECSG